VFGERGIVLLQRQLPCNKVLLLTVRFEYCVEAFDGARIRSIVSSVKKEKVK
jgi:hypothetical protein